MTKLLGTQISLPQFRIRIYEDKFRTYRAHCSYLDIYISQKIRLCRGDLEGQFQTSLQAKVIIFLSENSDLLHSFFFYFFQNLSNPLLFTHCCSYSNELTYLNCNLTQKCNSSISTFFE